MSPAELVGPTGEVLARIFEGQEAELLNAEGKRVYVKGTQKGFDVKSTESYGSYGPEEKLALLQLQHGQVLRPIALKESSVTP